MPNAFVQFWQHPYFAHYNFSVAQYVWIDMVASLCQVPCLSKHLGLYTQEWYHIVDKFVLKSHLIRHCNTFDKDFVQTNWKIVKNCTYVSIQTYEHSCFCTFMTCLQNLEGGLLPFVSGLSLVLLLISKFTNGLRLHNFLETCSPQ